MIVFYLTVLRFDLQKKTNLLFSVLFTEHELPSIKKFRTIGKVKKLADISAFDAKKNFLESHSLALKIRK